MVVVEQVLAGRPCATLEIAHGGVHIGEYPRIAAGADPLHGSADVGSGNVVEQYAIRYFAGKPEHLRVQRRQYDLRPALAETHAEAESFHLPEVAFEGYRFTGQALPHQGDVLAHHGNRPLGTRHAMLAEDARCGDAQSEPDIRVRAQGLQGRCRHGVQRGRAELNRYDAGRQVDVRDHRRNGCQQGEGIGARRFDGPQRTVVHRFRQLGDRDSRGWPEYGKAADRYAQRRGSCHCRFLLSGLDPGLADGNVKRDRLVNLRCIPPVCGVAPRVSRSEIAA